MAQGSGLPGIMTPCPVVKCTGSASASARPLPTGGRAVTANRQFATAPLVRFGVRGVDNEVAAEGEERGEARIAVVC